MATWASIIHFTANVKAGILNKLLNTILGGGILLILHLLGIYCRTQRDDHGRDTIC